MTPLDALEAAEARLREAERSGVPEALEAARRELAWVWEDVSRLGALLLAAAVRAVPGAGWLDEHLYLSEGAARRLAEALGVGWLSADVERVAKWADRAGPDLERLGQRDREREKRIYELEGSVADLRRENWELAGAVLDLRDRLEALEREREQRDAPPAEAVALGDEGGRPRGPEWVGFGDGGG